MFKVAEVNIDSKIAIFLDLLDIFEINGESCDVRVDFFDHFGDQILLKSLFYVYWCADKLITSDRSEFFWKFIDQIFKGLLPLVGFVLIEEFLHLLPVSSDWAHYHRVNNIVIR